MILVSVALMVIIAMVSIYIALLECSKITVEVVSMIDAQRNKIREL